jgi:hypothetical protein
MRVQIKFDPEDVKSFHKSIDSLFEDIRVQVSSPATYNTVVAKTKRGMRENRLALVNSGNWERVKTKLKSEGKINYKDPLNVTGNLVNDYYASIMNKGPKDLENIGVEMSFKDIPRMRPTMQSMYAVSRNPEAQLEYEMKSSLQIATKLERYTGTLNGVNYNISEAIYKLYQQDYVKAVEIAVHKAFNKNK